MEMLVAFVAPFTHAIMTHTHKIQHKVEVTKRFIVIVILFDHTSFGGMAGNTENSKLPSAFGSQNDIPQRIMNQENRMNSRHDAKRSTFSNQKSTESRSRNHFPKSYREPKLRSRFLVEILKYQKVFGMVSSLTYRH